MKPLALGGAVLAAILAGPTSASGQEPAPSPPILVFLDCQTSGCDDDFIMSELTWVSWVRDRAAADVHVLITSQEAGGRGRALYARLPRQPRVRGPGAA